MMYHNTAPALEIGLKKRRNQRFYTFCSFSCRGQQGLRMNGRLHSNVIGVAGRFHGAFRHWFGDAMDLSHRMCTMNQALWTHLWHRVCVLQESGVNAGNLWELYANLSISNEHLQVEMLQVFSTDRFLLTSGWFSPSACAVRTDDPELCPLRQQPLAHVYWR